MPKYIIGSCPHHCVDNHGVLAAAHGSRVLWGGLQFSASPVVHDTKKKAENEAARLALAEPAKSFVIFQAVAAVRMQALPIEVRQLT